MEMGLCFIDTNGDFVLVGGNKIREKYNLTLKTEKIVPIRIGKNLVETATYVMSVRLHAKENQQRKMVEKKKSRKEIISHGSKRISKYYEKTFGEFTITDNTILSISPGINYGNEMLDFGVSANNVVLYNFTNFMLAF